MLLPIFSIKFDHTHIFGSAVYGQASRQIFTLSSNGTLFAYNVETMKSEWAVLLDCPTMMRCEFRSTPLVVHVGEANENVIIGGAYAFDAYTGNLVWKREDLTDTINNTPVASKSVPPIIYVGSRLSNLIALDSLTGDTIFKKVLDGGKVTTVVLGVLGKKLYVGTKIALQRQGPIENPDITDGFLFCIDASNGKEHWRFQPAYRNSFLYAPCIHNDIIITSTFQPTDALNHYIYGVSIETGKLVWSHSIGNARVLGSAVSSPKQDLVFVPCNNGMIFTFKGSTGTLIWIYNTKNGIDTTPMMSLTSYNTAIVFADTTGNIHLLSCITPDHYSFEVYKAHFRTISTPYLIASDTLSFDYLLITGSNGRLNIYNYSAGCDSMEYVDFVPTLSPTSSPINEGWYNEAASNSSLLNTTNKLTFLIYLIIVISIVIVLLRYIVRRCYATYQEKKKTQLNVSNKKKKKSITIIHTIRRLFLSSSAAAAYRVVDDDDNGDDSMSTHLGQYYDINSNHPQSLQRRGVTVNPLHQAQDIDTTDIRAHIPLNV